jgi:hypothetical protein
MLSTINNSERHDLYQLLNTPIEMYSEKSTIHFFTINTE